MDFNSINLHKINEQEILPARLTAPTIACNCAQVAKIINYLPPAQTTQARAVHTDFGLGGGGWRGAKFGLTAQWDVLITQTSESGTISEKT